MANDLLQNYDYRKKHQAWEEQLKNVLFTVNYHGMYLLTLLKNPTAPMPDFHFESQRQREIVMGFYEPAKEILGKTGQLTQEEKNLQRLLKYTIARKILMYLSESNLRLKHLVENLPFISEKKRLDVFHIQDGKYAGWQNIQNFDEMSYSVYWIMLSTLKLESLKLEIDFDVLSEPQLKAICAVLKNCQWQELILVPQRTSVCCLTEKDWQKFLTFLQNVPNNPTRNDQHTLIFDSEVHLQFFSSRYDVNVDPKKRYQQFVSAIAHISSLALLAQIQWPERNENEPIVSDEDPLIESEEDIIDFFCQLIRNPNLQKLDLSFQGLGGYAVIDKKLCEAIGASNLVRLDISYNRIHLSEHFVSAVQNCHSLLKIVVDPDNPLSEEVKTILKVRVESLIKGAPAKELAVHLQLQQLHRRGATPISSQTSGSGQQGIGRVDSNAPDRSEDSLYSLCRIS